MDLATEQRRRNTASQAAWDKFAPHRAQVTRLLELAAPATAESRVCILGAGNGNDLDLHRLLQVYPEVHLVDLDASALEFGARQQGLLGCERLCLHGDRDVTGVLGRLRLPAPDLAKAPPLDADALLQELRRPVDLGIAPCTTVASVCVLTQLIESALLVTGPGHPRLLEIVLAIRHQHLDLMVRLLEPGGQGLLITDFVSSDTCPELSQIRDEDLAGNALNWINRQNFFTGVNPFAIRRVLSMQSEWRIDSSRVHFPWRWDLGLRTYAVTAVEFRKSAGRRVTPTGLEPVLPP